jgi:hypothetical protein
MRCQIVALSAACLLPACAELHHNDVLIFGTETKIALDVSSSPTAGGAPAVTLGYKRSEAVWMPLIVNGTQSKLVPEVTGTAGPGQAPLADAKYRSSITREPKNGPKVTQEDAYSVFASFGAKIGGGANPGVAEGKVGLAQFFATGNAAINVSENEALVTALKVDDAGSSRAQADAVSAAAGNETLRSIRDQLSAAEVAEAEKIVKGRIQLRDQRIASVLACAQTGAQYRWDKIAEKLPGYDTEQLQAIAATPESQLRNYLLTNPSVLDAAITVGSSEFNCAGVQP